MDKIFYPYFSYLYSNYNQNQNFNQNNLQQQQQQYYCSPTIMSQNVSQHQQQNYKLSNTSLSSNNQNIVNDKRNNKNVRKKSSNANAKKIQKRLSSTKSNYQQTVYSLTNPNYLSYRTGAAPPLTSTPLKCCKHLNYNNYSNLNLNNSRYYPPTTTYPCLSSTSSSLSTSLPQQQQQQQQLNQQSSLSYSNNVKLHQLGNRLQSWKTASIGISFLVLLLLICKLHDVDREINYLNYISTEWLSQQSINNQLLSPATSIVESLRKRIDNIDSDSNNNIDYYHNHNHNPLLLLQDDQNINNSSNNNLYSLMLMKFNNQSINNFTNNNKKNDKLQIGSKKIKSQQNSASRQQQQQQLIDNKSNNDQQQLSSSSNNDIIELTNIISIITYLKDDIDVLMSELMASRTTLLLSLIFVLVYILSWCWMAYAIRATNTPQDISLKTVLLLAIFAAVDIAASAGFVMVRIIMYIMRDYYFPRDMRIPLYSIEYNQLPAHVALRLSSMKSSTGVIDIFVSVIVTFLTSLRVYSVICAVTFYRRARKELLNLKNFEYIIERPLTTRYPSILVNNNHNNNNLHNHHRSSMIINNNNNGNKSSIPLNNNNNGINKIDSNDLGQSGYLPKIRLLSAHKDLDRRFSINHPHHHHSFSHHHNNHTNNQNNRQQQQQQNDITNSSNNSDNNSTDISTSSANNDVDVVVVDPSVELKIQAADMPTSIQKSAMQSTIQALRTYTTEKHIAESIKQNFDQLYEPTWHCIVGRNWGSCVTHTKSNYIRMLYKDLTILLYKSS